MFAKLRGDGEPFCLQLQKQPRVYLYIFYILFLYFSLYPEKQKVSHFCRNCSHSNWRFQEMFTLGYALLVTLLRLF